MNRQRQTTVSKFLSKHLRHQPERLGLTLQPGGWVAIADLLAACANHGFPIRLDELQTVVAENDKQRFSFDQTGTKIRANQGHSTSVDLQLTPDVPPPTLYHGTGAGAVASIEAIGLLKQSRHHVHLSVDRETAQRVGMRHGRPVVFEIDAQAMHQAGFVFYCSDNGVWLVDQVPPCYLRKRDPRS